MTVNKAHGLTCDATMMLGDDLLYRELVYEAMSRGRKENRIYMSRGTMTELDLQLEDGPHARTVEPQDPIAILAAGLERRHNKHLALDSIASIPLEVWSTSDLLAERERVRAVLGQAPADRSADIAALIESRRDIERKLRETKLSVATLECRKRPRRERRLPDVDLLTQRHNLGHFQQQADRLDRAVVALQGDQHRRASHLAAHGADQIELDAIGNVLRERIHRNTNRAVADPPSYITRTLGARPSNGVPDRAWVSAVVAIETYRVEHDITDRRTAIGPEPADPRRALDWLRANEAILDAREVISPPPLTRIQPAVERQITRPSLGLSL